MRDEVIPLDEFLLARLQGAFARYGIKFWNAARERGTLGCRPDTNVA